MLTNLADNLRRVRDRMAEACLRAGRQPSEVRLVAVTKYVDAEVIRALVDMGVRDLGESRVQELTRRAPALREVLGTSMPQAGAATAPRWHLVGSLQRNKVRPLLPWVDLIHSVDSLRLAEEIDATAAKLGRRVPALLQINTSMDSNKHGVSVGAATHLAEQIVTLKHLELRGLMAMAPLSGNLVAVRQAFERARELFDEIVAERAVGPAFRELSMGMSNDFETAIAEGATMVRIGSALYEGLRIEAEHAPDGVEEAAAKDP